MDLLEAFIHGSAPVAVNMSNSGYDLSRAVRSDRYKFIDNCTPWLPYSPVDSADGAAWREMTAANDANQLTPGLRATYFTTPRPVYELYDLDHDPSELNNLSGQPEVAAVERSLRLSLAEKMILDFDYLPLPAITGTRGAIKQNAKPSDRGVTFKRLDTDRDGKLSKTEFSANREPSDAKLWFTRRDTDQDGFINRAEYLANHPPSVGKP